MVHFYGFSAGYARNYALSAAAVSCHKVMNRSAYYYNLSAYCKRIYIYFRTHRRRSYIFKIIGVAVMVNDLSAVIICIFPGKRFLFFLGIFPMCSERYQNSYIFSGNIHIFAQIFYKQTAYYILPHPKSC